jgi:hypothetical protein
MTMWRSGRPFVEWNEIFRLLSALVGLLGIFVLELMTPRGIALWIGYSFALWYLSRVSRKPAIFLPLVAHAMVPLTPHHRMYASNLLRKQGTL